MERPAATVAVAAHEHAGHAMTAMEQVEMMAAEERRKAPPSVPVNGHNAGNVHDNKSYNGIASQLRKFALHFIHHC